jgi:hypothetical protein
MKKDFRFIIHPFFLRIASDQFTIANTAMMNVRTLGRILCLAAVTAGMVGCADRKPKRYAVSGEVRFQGKPLDQGGITFLGEDLALGSGWAAIKDGKYSIPAKEGLLAGRYKVSVASADPRSKAPDPDSPPGYLPLPKDRIQPKYNSQTTLSADVRAEGPNTFNFEVH